MRWLGCTLFSICVLLLLLSCLGIFFPADLLIAVTLGWAFYLYRVIPQVHINGNGVATAVICLVGFGLGLHSFLNWLVRSSPKVLSDDSAPRWRARWTVEIVAITLLMFVTGMAAAGFVHQVGWLITSPRPLLDGSSGVAVQRAQSTNNLKQTAVALLNLQNKEGHLAPGCTVDRDGEPLQSWMTLILPFMEEQKLVDRLDLELPWNHPTNAPVFRERIQGFLHPAYSDRPPSDPDGFALSHYSANVHVLGGTRRLAQSDIKDGTSETIMAGEIADRFPAWGQPGNWRDPALGINHRADGFGGPFPGGANFMFADGSVRFLKNSISPQVLNALSTPAGGESVNTDQY
jgi:prepilin-type processing-associated H-X9-DG protein